MAASIPGCLQLFLAQAGLLKGVDLASGGISVEAVIFPVALLLTRGSDSLFFFLRKFVLPILQKDLVKDVGGGIFQVTNP